MIQISVYEYIVQIKNNNADLKFNIICPLYYFLLFLFWLWYDTVLDNGYCDSRKAYQ